MQGTCAYFDHYLTQTDGVGLCIADSRNKFKNVGVSHSIFTQKFSSAARSYQRLVELPPSDTARITLAFKSATSSARPYCTRWSASPIAAVA